MNKGLVFEVKSKATNLIEFQAGRGFAGLSEATMRKVCQELKWNISPSPTGVDECHHLAVVGLLNHDPRLTEEEVVQKICFRSQVEKNTPDIDDPELEQVVRDTLLVGEQDQALRELTRRRGNLTAKTLRPKVRQMYQVAAKGVKAWSDKANVEARKAKEKKEVADGLTFQKNIERVYAKLKVPVDVQMKALLPAAVRAWSDQKNGRWKLTYKGLHVQFGRSISWTSIGHGRAAAECVRQGWQWLEVHEGRSMPESVETKLKKLVETG